MLGFRWLWPLLLFVHAAPSWAAAGGGAPIAYLYDLTHDAVLVDRQADQPFAPASMTKMMTVHIAFDLLAQGKLKESDMFTVRDATWARWNNRGSTMYLTAGSKVSVGDLINGIVTLSGNDASVVLAEGIAGSEAAFVKRMNAKAKQLGMTRSRFGTSNGWPDNGRTRTTARDLALLVAATLRNYPQLYRRYYARPAFSWNGISQPNRNPILGRVKGADGLKTGHTDEAGYCFAGSAQQAGRRLVMIVAGTTSESARAAASVQLMQSGFTDWRARKLAHKQHYWAMAPVLAGAAAQVALVTPPTARWLQPAATAAPARISVHYQGPVAAPIAKGQRLGALIIEHPWGFRQQIPLLAADAVAEAGFLRRGWLGLLRLLGIA